MPRYKLSRLAFLVSASTTGSCWAQDWPQWRGPNRDGAISYFSEPKTWPERLTLKWKVKLGEGYASPVVAGGTVYVHTRQQEREVVSSLRLDTGQTLWQETYPAPFRRHIAAFGHGRGPKSTPVLSNERLYTFGISGVLSCFDATTGRLQWRKDSSGRPAFGTALSPVVENGLLIAHIGGSDDSALTAFDAETGEPKWSWEGDGPAYASPIVVDLGGGTPGAPQVVTQSERNLVGISASTGELLWQIPFTTSHNQNIVTPLLYQQTLIFSGLGNGVMAIKVFKRGNQWSTEKVWHNKDVSMYMNSPVVGDDLLFGLSHRNRGQFFCLDPRTGATLWTTKGREGHNAAILQAGSVLFWLTSDAELIVARTSAKAFEPLRRYTVADSSTYAHPVILGDRILIKDVSTLALWSLN